MLSLQDLFDTLFKAYGNQYWWPAETYDETIIGAILTQNTAWTNVEKAIINLKNNNIITLNDVVNCSQNYLASLIKPTGYFNIKASRLKNVALHLHNYNFKNRLLNENREFLLNIKGIGPETADSILLYAMEYPVFVVDSYTQRLITRLGFELSDYKYHTIQRFFMRNIDNKVEIFNEYHALIVNHCKVYCKAKPDCKNCFINNECSFSEEI